MRRSRFFLLLAFAALPVLGCSSGDECDTCSTDEDCKDGFVCSSFEDGSSRCGSGLGVTTCRVR
jgi:hypothetical protein